MHLLVGWPFNTNADFYSTEPALASRGEEILHGYLREKKRRGVS